jgi:hypothetical protein
MSYGFMGFGMFIFTLPILIGQWVGILYLGKVQRNAAWWWMIFGIGCTTLGTLGSIASAGLMMSGIGSPSGSMPAGTYAMVAAGGLSGLGSLLFTIGFALHGMHASRRFQRISELEAITAAQGEELNRHRAGYESAS